MCEGGSIIIGFRRSRSRLAQILLAGSTVRQQVPDQAGVPGTGYRRGRVAEESLEVLNLQMVCRRHENSFRRGVAPSTQVWKRGKTGTLDRRERRGGGGGRSGGVASPPDARVNRS